MFTLGVRTRGPFSVGFRPLMGRPRSARLMQVESLLRAAACPECGIVPRDRLNELADSVGLPRHVLRYVQRTYVMKEGVTHEGHPKAS